MAAWLYDFEQREKRTGTWARPYSVFLFEKNITVELHHKINPSAEKHTSALGFLITHYSFLITKETLI